MNIDKEIEALKQSLADKYRELEIKLKQAQQTATHDQN